MPPSSAMRSAIVFRRFISSCTEDSFSGTAGGDGGGARAVGGALNSIVFRRFISSCPEDSFSEGEGTAGGVPGGSIDERDSAPLEGGGDRGIVEVLGVCNRGSIGSAVRSARIQYGEAPVVLEVRTANVLIQ